jgi:predicted ferric reductase
MTGAITNQLPWYVARAGGLIAWAACTASIVWGLLLSTRLVRRRGVPAWLLDLHRFLGVLALVFTAVHLSGLWFDSYVHFGPRELLVPMATTWRPGAVAWGIAGLYLLLAIQVSSWLMRRMPRRVWHTIHLSSFALFIVATVHGVTAGADAHNLLVDWLALVGGALVTFLVLVRVLSPRNARRTELGVARTANGSRATPAPGGGTTAQVA